MSHAFKKVAVAPPAAMPFVRAVTDLGDLWYYSPHLPRVIRRMGFETTHDRRDAALMSLMEMGQLPRVSE